MSLYQEAVRILKERNIPLSHQRLKVTEYLYAHSTHPTAEEIYAALHKEIPTLSLTTVYNTLKLLVANGCGVQLDTGDGEAKFDGNTAPHGHFKCTECGAVYDFDLKQKQGADFGLPEGFLSKEAIVLIKGKCGRCVNGGK